MSAALFVLAALLGLGPPVALALTIPHLDQHDDTHPDSIQEQS